MAYEIRPGKTAPCELVQIVEPRPGITARPAPIAEGTHTHCARILAAINEGKERQCPAT